MASWIIASKATDNTRDCRLVALAGILPDADGLGVKYEYSDGHAIVRKSFRFQKDSYQASVSSEVTVDGKPVRSMFEWLGGFGDLTVIFIAALFLAAAGFESSSVTTWAGQIIIETAGSSQTRLLALIMLVAAMFCVVISVNGTAVALLPVLVVVAVRLGFSTSQLLLPMCFAAHAATMLTLIGALRRMQRRPRQRSLMQSAATY